MCLSLPQRVAFCNLKQPLDVYKSRRWKVKGRDKETYFRKKLVLDCVTSKPIININQVLDKSKCYLGLLGSYIHY